jgi:hypothetical protein
MQTKISVVVYMVLAAVLLLGSVSVATAAWEAKATSAGSMSSQDYGNVVVTVTPGVERDFYQCLQPATVLPSVDEIRTCMVQKGNSDQATSDIIKSLPDQELFAPYTSYESRGN